jgi:hypothetical protein
MAAGQKVPAPALDQIVTTDQIMTTDQVSTTDQTATSQTLMYNVHYGDSVYHYTIDESGAPTKQGKYKIPYTADFPRIAYNDQLSMLEVVGDYSATSYTADSNSYHYRMSENGQFSSAQSSLWSPVLYGSLVYVESVGTLCLGGYNGSASYATQIVTPNTDWASVSPDNYYLADYSSDTFLPHQVGYEGLGVTTNGNVLYIASGYGIYGISNKGQLSYICV